MAKASIPQHGAPYLNTRKTWQLHYTAEGIAPNGPIAVIAEAGLSVSKGGKSGYPSR